MTTTSQLARTLPWQPARARGSNLASKASNLEASNLEASNLASNLPWQPARAPGSLSSSSSSSSISSSSSSVIVCHTTMAACARAGFTDFLKHSPRDICEILTNGSRSTSNDCGSLQVPESWG